MKTNQRIESIDLLKGLVMVVMALDHTRDYFHQSSSILSLTDPATATIPVYLTRWITHFCAPAFAFLAGLSAFFVSKRKSTSEVSSFLIKRGLWLIFLEVTVITFAWTFDIHYSHIFLQVIWSLGFSMLVLAALVYLPKKAILIFSLVLIFGHNLLDYVHVEGNFLWSMMHEFSTFQLTENTLLTVVYPIVPWAGVMSLGYYFGTFYSKETSAERRKKLFNGIGLGAILGFVVIRFFNFYGNLGTWAAYETSTQTLMSFFDLTKYPPSLLFLLVTLSGTILFLANSEKWKGKIVDFFTVFGRVPFFYYIIHLYVIRVLALLFAEFSGFGWELMVQTKVEIVLGDFGYNLSIVYLIWISIIIMLYPVCKCYDGYKQANKDKWWLSYL
jgi:uncharacterized membrane protein